MARGLQPRVSLLGRVSVEADGVVLDEARFPGRQGRLLFAYLVAERGRAVPRDELAEALWGEAPPPTWDKALTGLVSKLRGLLGEQGIDGASALTAAFGCYRLELPKETWVDLLAASAATDDAVASLASGDLDGARGEAAVAESLLREPFLPGEDGAWVEQKRRELADLRGRALGVLTDASLGGGDAPAAAAWAEQAVALEPFRERGYRRLMEAHVAAGDRAEALRVYERCRRLLAEELGAYPSPETESLYRALLEAPAAPADGAQRFAVVPEPDVSSGSVPSDGAAAGPAVDRRRRRRRGVPVPAAAFVCALVLVTAGTVGWFVAGGDDPGGASASTVGANAVAAIDLSQARPGAAVPLPASPGAIAFGESSVWVAMPNRNSLARIDPQSSAVQQTISTGSGPAAIAIGGGFVWVANSLDGTVWQVDPQKDGGQVVARIPVGNGPTGVAYGLGGVWVANSVDRAVVLIDPKTGKSAPAIPIEGGADAIAVGDGAVWVTGKQASVLTRVDPRSETVAPIHVGNAPTAVAAGHGAVWVASGQDATVWRIDPTTNRVVGTVTVGEGPSGVALTHGGRSVWVANALSGTLSKIDTALGRVVETVAVGDQPQGVAASASRAYVAVRGSSGAAHRGGTLTVAVANAADVYQKGLVEALDPSSGDSWDLLMLTNDGLVGYGRSGGADGYRVVPDLAVALPAVSDGGRTYTFKLRPGIRFSTGAVVRPEDVRRGLERSLVAFGPDSHLNAIVGSARCLAAPARCDLSKGVVTDAKLNTVVVRLSSPDPDFLYKLALPSAAAVPADTPLRARAPLPATGPYKVDRIDVARNEVRLVRNPYFRLWSAAAQPDGAPDEIVVRYGYTAKSAINAVVSGEADLTGNGYDQTWTPALAQMLRTRYSSRLYMTPTWAPTSVWLNTRVAPFDDVRVRRAVNFAVDRNHLIEIAGGPEVAEVGCQMLPPNVDGYKPYCPYTLRPNAAGVYNGPDLATARRLVAASGTRGQAVTVWFYDIPIGRRNSAYLVSVLRSLGYDARRELLAHAGSTWRPDRQAGIGGTGAVYPSAYSALWPFFTCRAYTADPGVNQNTSGLCDQRIDAMIARARDLQITDPAAASKLWTRIDRELTDLAPRVVFRQSVAADFVSERVRNYTPCWQAYWNGTTGACLGQLWLR